jgi:hypothetical protein
MNCSRAPAPPSLSSGLGMGDIPAHFSTKIFLLAPELSTKKINVNLKPVGSCTVCPPCTSNKERKEEKNGMANSSWPSPGSNGEYLLKL